MSGIYLHIPFCKQACHYCDFHFSTSLRHKEEMLQAITKELHLRKKELDAPIETIYFGGGTPSLLNTDELQLLLKAIYKNYSVIESPEITLEANPDDLTEKRLKELAHTPINRLSLGVQSFFDQDLLWMNRAHSSEQAKTSLNLAMQAFDNITVDLIYGIPGLNHERWKENIKIALDFGVGHISSYALTVEPKTALAAFIKKGKVKPLDEKQASEQFQILCKELKKAGFIHYEISNFGKPGAISKHNSSYWQGKPYIGVGPSAHSYNKKQRAWNPSNNMTYLKALQKDELPLEIENLQLNDRFNETLMTGLRTIWGVSLEQMTSEFGKNYTDYLLKQAQSYLENGSLTLDNKTLKVAEKAKFFSDGIAADLFMI